jgi:hypothetical protein
MKAVGHARRATSIVAAALVAVCGAGVAADSGSAGLVGAWTGTWTGAASGHLELTIARGLLRHPR